MEPIFWMIQNVEFACGGKVLNLERLVVFKLTKMRQMDRSF